MSDRTVHIVEPKRRVIRYYRDLAGNDLTAILQWCSTHAEPIWIYNDGSGKCPHEWHVGAESDDHVIVPPPWEIGQ